MEALKKALWDSFQVEIEPGDTINLSSPYCDKTIVDVLVTDGYTGKVFIFEGYSMTRQAFPV